MLLRKSCVAFTFAEAKLYFGKGWFYLVAPRFHEVAAAGRDRSQPPDSKNSATQQGRTVRFPSVAAILIEIQITPGSCLSHPCAGWDLSRLRGWELYRPVGISHLVGISPSYGVSPPPPCCCLGSPGYLPTPAALSLLLRSWGGYPPIPSAPWAELIFRSLPCSLGQLHCLGQNSFSECCLVLWRSPTACGGTRVQNVASFSRAAPCPALPCTAIRSHANPAKMSQHEALSPH